MDLEERIMELSRHGYFCGQILAILLMETLGEENVGFVRAMGGLNGGGRSLELHDHHKGPLALIGVGGLVAVDGHDLYVSGLCTGIGDDDGGRKAVNFNHTKSCHIGNSFAYLAM